VQNFENYLCMNFENYLCMNFENYLCMNFENYLCMNFENYLCKFTVRNILYKNVISILRFKPMFSIRAVAAKTIFLLAVFACYLSVNDKIGPIIKCSLLCLSDDRGFYFFLLSPLFCKIFPLS
jgi:hypothetical protein